MAMMIGFPAGLAAKHHLSHELSKPKTKNADSIRVRHLFLCRFWRVLFARNYNSPNGFLSILVILAGSQACVASFNGGT
jgi:hypothetical protein